MGKSPRVVSRFNAVVVVFAFTIQLINGFEILSVFNNILYFPSVEALYSSSAVFIKLNDISLKLIYISCKSLHLCLQRSELVSVVLRGTGN